MEHNHFEHCLQGWPTLLALLMLASLGSAAFIALLGGVGWLLASRQRSVMCVAPPVLVTSARTAEGVSGPVVTGADREDAAGRRPAERPQRVTGSGPAPAACRARPVPPLRDPKPGEGACAGVRRWQRAGHTALARGRALVRGRVRRVSEGVPGRT
jgi:hypothetical protein